MGVRTSTLTLSVSMTTTTSSTATPSPTCAVHSTTVPSVMESPMLGTGRLPTLSNRANRPSAGCCGFWVRASENCREALLTATGLAARRPAPRARGWAARKSMLQGERQRVNTAAALARHLAQRRRKLYTRCSLTSRDASHRLIGSGAGNASVSY